MARSGRERRRANHQHALRSGQDLQKHPRNYEDCRRIRLDKWRAKRSESALQIVRPNPDIALRSGPPPEMLTASTAEGELQVAVKKILAWRGSGLKPSEIAVLYRADTEGWVKRLASLISQQTAVYWPHDTSGSFVDPSGVCVRTMHSAKGLQWRAVLVMRCDMMPFLAGPSVDRAEQERLERGLMYVAMTRAEEMTCFHSVNLEWLRISDSAASRPRRCEGKVGKPRLHFAPRISKQFDRPNTAPQEQHAGQAETFKVGTFVLTDHGGRRVP